MSNSEFAEPYTIIEPFGGPFKGDVTVPGDKSISHRAVLFAAMAEGTSHLSGVLDSEDVRASIRAVEALGAEVDLKAQPDGSLSGTVTGWGAEGPSPARRPHRLRQLGHHGAPAHGHCGPVGHRGDHHRRRVAAEAPHAPHRGAPGEDGRRFCARDAGDAAHHRVRQPRPARPSTTRAPWPRPS